jgi:Zn-dependent protease
VIFLLSDLSIGAIAGILLGLVAGIAFHEFSHAFVADLLGDRRPRALGRVSLNPLRHLDPLGTALLLLVGIGWGKPVPVAVEALRPGRIGMAYVAAAGPISNVVIASGLAVVFRLLELVGLDSGMVRELLFWAVQINLLLALLNLIPIPPLDGSAVLLAIVPPRWEYVIRQYQGFGVALLVILLLVPNSPLSALLGLAEPWAAILCGI